MNLFRIGCPTRGPGFYCKGLLLPPLKRSYRAEPRIQLDDPVGPTGPEFLSDCMDRLTTFSEKWRELDEVSKERALTSEECSDLSFYAKALEDQVDVHVRQLQSKDAYRSTGSTKRTSRKAQLYHLRLSLTDQYNFGTFDKLMAKMAKSAWVETGMFVYVYEQSGADPSTMGHNPHAHIRFKSMESHGRLLYKVKRATSLTDAAVKLLAHDNVNALRQYMLGHKGDADKLVKGKMDIIWRLKNKLKDQYIL